MSTVRWSEIRGEHVAAAGEERVEQGKTRLLGQVRAHRLAETRKRRGLTQRQVAQAMGVTVGRVSQIENGELAGIDVLDRYVHALGGHLQIVANFGDEQIKVG
ncbi:helix-turn-helix domain protein [Pseudonocardia dioxanivorans CB1190]|uniref:Helix-turn-helix domain protein n=1 Tax=Pseudonocardia dioxanivorans (strain ATCC 55486 / DSM 44775 / JCM 13855 / CB1190) TaxID=675635 RepID=F4CKS9_PSEUX|nr:helix-turn-helix transcriptional regulator [Pseudonocardia dioxanivorans]AEA23567.1 helix-turn-helix domain protein [Pseudonocardia dioxanivorans CB1190]GJF07523.1 transcriptional regulator [Pseudonocardia sp. D17]